MRNRCILSLSETLMEATAAGRVVAWRAAEQQFAVSAELVAVSSQRDPILFISFAFPRGFIVGDISLDSGEFRSAFIYSLLELLVRI